VVYECHVRRVKRIFRAALSGLSVVGLSVLSLAAPGGPVEAGFAPDAIALSLFNGEWSESAGFEDSPTVDLTDVTAVMVGFPVTYLPEPECLELLTPEGSEQDFRFVVDANGCLEVQDLGSAAVTLPVAQFFWGSVNEGSVSQLVRCMDVVGESSTEGAFETRVLFSDLLVSAASATAEDVVSSMLAEVSGLRNSAVTSNETRVRLRGTSFVPFILAIDQEDIPPPEGFTPEDAVWTIGLSITSCRDDVDENLLEHYQRQAELIEASALPDTL